MTFHQEPALGQRIAWLPEDAATKSRDYGRGYAQAVRDVLDLLWAHDGAHTLLEECGCTPETVTHQLAQTPRPSFEANAKEGYQPEESRG